MTGISFFFMICWCDPILKRESGSTFKLFFLGLKAFAVQSLFTQDDHNTAALSSVEPVEINNFYFTYSL